MKKNPKGTISRDALRKNHLFMEISMQAQEYKRPVTYGHRIPIHHGTRKKLKASSHQQEPPI